MISGMEGQAQISRTAWKSGPSEGAGIPAIPVSSVAKHTRSAQGLRIQEAVVGLAGANVGLESARTERGAFGAQQSVFPYLTSQYTMSPNPSAVYRSEERRGGKE